MIAAPFRLFCVAAGLAAGLGPSVAADASDWARGAKSSARLILGAETAPGVWRAGVEIELAAGALTYWRSPGEAGIPPRFSFEGSDNLGAADVAYPAPRRFEEAGADLFGYSGRVVFPLTLRAADAGRPIALRLSLDYGVCEKICIPVHAALALDLAPKAPPSALGRHVDKAFAKIPRPAPLAADGPLAILAVEPVAGAAKPEFRIRVRAAEGADLFGEAPDFWFVETEAAEGGFRLVVAERPKDAPRSVDVRLTLVSGGAAIETGVRLDLPAPAP